MVDTQKPTNAHLSLEVLMQMGLHLHGQCTLSIQSKTAFP